MNLNKLFAVFEQKKLSYVDGNVHTGGSFFTHLLDLMVEGTQYKLAYFQMGK